VTLLEKFVNKSVLNKPRQLIWVGVLGASVVVSGIGATEQADTKGTSQVLNSDEDTRSKGNAKSMYLVIFRRGPSWVPGKSVAEQPLKEHGRYLLSLHRKGALKFAGPFADDSGGAMVLETLDDAQAEAIVSADPAVVGRVLTFELHRWTLVPWANIAAQTRSAVSEASGSR
jgi:uncharacterized protein